MTIYKDTKDGLTHEISIHEDKYGWVPFAVVYNEDGKEDCWYKMYDNYFLYDNNDCILPLPKDALIHLICIALYAENLKQCV
jgi:hypothetical protein